MSYKIRIFMAILLTLVVGISYFFKWTWMIFAISIVMIILSAVPYKKHSTNAQEDASNG
jgi:hypothetical protein